MTSLIEPTVLAKWWLRRRGYKVMRPATFAEALALSKQQPSPLIRADLLAPIESTLEARVTRFEEQFGDSEQKLSEEEYVRTMDQADCEEALYDAREYLIAGLANQAEWWEHLGDAHRDYAALARAIEALGFLDEVGRLHRMADVVAERDRLRRGIRRVIADSPGTPDSVKKYLLRELEGSWGEPYEEAMLRG